MSRATYREIWHLTEFLVTYLTAAGAEVVGLVQADDLVEALDAAQKLGKSRDYSVLLVEEAVNV